MANSDRQANWCCLFVGWLNWGVRSWKGKREIIGVGGKAGRLTNGRPLDGRTEYTAEYGVRPTENNKENKTKAEE